MRTSPDRKKENYIKQLCSLGLESRVFVPELLRALRELVPFPQGAFIWVDKHLNSVDFYAEWELPGREILEDIYYSEFLQTGRLAEVFHDTAYIRSLPPVTRQEQSIKLSKCDYLKHDYYHLIARPSQTHHCFRVRLEEGGKPLAELSLNRPPGDPDFSQKDEQALARITPFIAHALAREGLNGDSAGPWVDSEDTGFIIFGKDGKIRHRSPSADNLLACAVQPARSPPSTALRYRPQQRITELLVRLSQSLENIFQGRSDSLPPVLHHCNSWGRFIFRAYWLVPCQQDDNALIGVTLQRQIPLQLRLLERLRDSPLSARERQLCLLLARGGTYADIARALCLSERTVITHSQNIFAKLQAENRTEFTSKLLFGLLEKP